MADKILPIVLKTGSNAPTAANNLREGEPAYSKNLDQLFIGNGAGVAPTAVQMQGQELVAKLGTASGKAVITGTGGGLTIGTVPVTSGGTWSNVFHKRSTINW